MHKPTLARFAGEPDGAVPPNPCDSGDLIGRLKQAVSRSITGVSLPWGKENAVAEPATDKDVRRRRQRRAKEIRTCEIRFDGYSTSAMVLNLSDGAAEVRLPQHLSRLPRNFTLKLPPDRIYECEIRWRDRDKVGVSLY